MFSLVSNTTVGILLGQGDPSIRRVLRTPALREVAQEPQNGLCCGVPTGRCNGPSFPRSEHTAATNLRRAGVDTMTAMKIVGHKSEPMHRRYNTVAPADLHQAAAKLNTYLTLANSAPTGQNATACNSSVGA